MHNASISSIAILIKTIIIIITTFITITIIIIIIIIIILTVIIIITTVINFNRYLLKRLNTIFEELLVLRFTTYYKIRLSVVTIYDSLDYYTSRQHVITIYDWCVIKIHDTCYYISRQVLQYTTSVITIHDRYYNSRHYYISRQHTRVISKSNERAADFRPKLHDPKFNYHFIRSILNRGILWS